MTDSPKASPRRRSPGIGESTRFAHETFGVRDQLFRRLVQDHGFRALAVQDGAAVAAGLDRYVRFGSGSAESALQNAWRPWRTAEMAGALEWIRTFNRDHPDDPVRIFGIKPLQAGPRTTTRSSTMSARQLRDLLEQAASHLDPIRTAHDIDEHVQRAQGIHPGRPFADHARDALALVESLPDPHPTMRRRRHPGADALIVDFHQRSVAGRGSYAGERGRVGRRDRRLPGTYGATHRLLGRHRAHRGCAGHSRPGSRARSASHRRQSAAKPIGTRYASVAIGFHHGDLGVAVVPDPAPDLVDAVLGETADRPAYWLDLRTAPVGRWDDPAKIRVISGVYDPSRDAAEHMAVTSLAAAFDVLVHIRRASPVRRLPA